MKKVEILGIKMALVTYRALLNDVFKAIKNGKYLGIAPVAIHPVTLAGFNKDYKAVLNKIDYVLPDSFWHLWGINFLYRLGQKERFYGPSLMKALCIRARKQGLNIYLYGGGKKETLDKIGDWCDSLPGGGKIYKFKASFSIDDKEIKDLAGKIVRRGKGVLFIGLGSPLQHEVLVKLKDKVNVPVIAVGAAFDFITGAKKQAPRWVHEAGFEWLYRLLQEPRRLAGRYLLSSLFFPLLILEKLKRSLF